MSTHHRSAEAVAAIKRRFVSIVSHELRTPLTAIKGAVDLVRRGQAGPLVTRQENLLAMASRNIERLAVILDDLLDLSKLQAGKLPLRPSRREIRALLGDQVEIFQQQAEEARIRLEFRCSQSLPEVYIDEQRIAQVLSNLLSNAIKFTPDGGKVSLIAERTANGVLIAVKDTGVGIAESDRDLVFEPFRQVEDVMTRRAKGTGLGLSIANAVVRQHAAELRLESRLGGGSCFSFELSADVERVRELCRWDREFAGQASSLLVVELSRQGAAASITVPERGPLLKRVEQWLTAELPRSTDNVNLLPAGGLVLVTLSGTDRKGAVTVRDRLRDQLERRLRNAADQPGVTPIVRGPSVYPTDGQTAHELIQAAREADAERVAGPPANVAGPVQTQRGRARRTAGVLRDAGTTQAA